MKFKNTLIALSSEFCEIFAKHPAKKFLWVCAIADPVVRAPILHGSIIWYVELSTWVSFIFCLSNDVKVSSTATFPWVALSIVKMWRAGSRICCSALCHAHHAVLVSLSWYKEALHLRVAPYPYDHKFSCHSSTQMFVQLFSEADNIKTLFWSSLPSAILFYMD